MEQSISVTITQNGNKAEVICENNFKDQQEWA